MLAPMLETGWRIVDAKPAELATLHAHGLVTAPKPR
jgi:hypothetical protein